MFFHLQRVVSIAVGIASFLKSMSKVVARIARSAIVSLFLNKFMFSQLGSILDLLDVK